MPVLHRRASEWCADNGLRAAAIEHALSAGDFERAAHLIEETAEATLMRSEVATFFSWVDRLPDGLTGSHPDLCVFHAWALLLSGRPVDEAEHRLQNMQGDTGIVQAKAAPLRALIAIYQGEVKHGSELASLALERLPPDDQLLRSIAAMALGMAHFMNGDTPAGTQALDEAARIGREIGNVMIAVSALSDLAGLSMREGQLHKAEAVYQQALELATDKAGRRLPIAGEALIGLGELARERNRLEDAALYLTEGIEFTRQWSKVAAMAGYMSLARVRQAQGDVAGASDAIHEARRLAVKFDVTEIDDLYVDVLQARLWLTQGNLDPVARWAEQRGLKEDIGASQLDWSDDFVNYHVRKYEHVVYARMLMALGQADQALVLLEPLLSTMEDRGRGGMVIEILVLQALAFQAQGRTSQALAALERALFIAEPAGYVRLFIDEGEPMSGLLRQAIRRGIAVGYARRLLTALEGATTEEPKVPALAGQPLIEPELEVLRLLTTSLTSTEIADELYIAPSTVRTHIKNIYGKLNVHGRIEAIQRAEELEML